MYTTVMLGTRTGRNKQSTGCTKHVTTIYKQVTAYNIPIPQTHYCIRASLSPTRPLSGAVSPVPSSACGAPRPASLTAKRAAIARALAEAIIAARNALLSAPAAISCLSLSLVCRMACRRGPRRRRRWATVRAEDGWGRVG